VSNRFQLDANWKGGLRRAMSAHRDVAALFQACREQALNGLKPCDSPRAPNELHARILPGGIILLS
jgi:hypothetical protein